MRVEGLDWLGRAPEAKASLPLSVRFGWSAASCSSVVFRFRIRTSGQEHLPQGRLPPGRGRASRLDGPVRRRCTRSRPQPRAWFLGSAPSTFTTRWRERLIHRVGGLLPVWRGGVGIDQHVASARAVVANGAVFVQMPEGTVSGPPGRIGPFRTGWAVIALRTDAPIVPLAIAGTEELYLGRRLALAGPAGHDGPGPGRAARRRAAARPGSREELDVARRMTDALAAILGPVVEALHPRRSTRRGTRGGSASG